ncbi:MAG: hypothetical protein IPP51_13030 [Bacteroidetes bacterium]|nr:hypothetical protein [Bacteroidota bacterium]
MARLISPNSGWARKSRQNPGQEAVNDQINHIKLHRRRPLLPGTHKTNNDQGDHT